MAAEAAPETLVVMMGASCLCRLPAFMLSPFCTCRSNVGNVPYNKKYAYLIQIFQLTLVTVWMSKKAKLNFKQEQKYQ